MNLLDCDDPASGPAGSGNPLENPPPALDKGYPLACEDRMLLGTLEMTLLHARLNSCMLGRSCGFRLRHCSTGAWKCPSLRSSEGAVFGFSQGACPHKIWAMICNHALVSLAACSVDFSSEPPTENELVGAPWISSNHH